jgi:hypothetical protein
VSKFLFFALANKEGILHFRSNGLPKYNHFLPLDSLTYSNGYAYKDYCTFPNTIQDIVTDTIAWGAELDASIGTPWSFGTQAVESCTPDSATGTNISTPQLMICDYNRCGSAVFRSTSYFSIHLKSHADQVLSECIKRGLLKCTWRLDCEAKAPFKSPKALRTHLENIHVNPLTCSEPGCRHKTPFRSNYELERHMKTVHWKERDFQWQCPYTNCDKLHKSFARKDKWVEHLRKHQFGTTCPFNHCDAGRGNKFSSQVEMVEHMQKCHGKYECGIGSCIEQQPSLFLEFQLLDHLKIHHAIHKKDVGAARNAAKLSRNHTIRTEHFSDPNSVPGCSICHGKKLGNRIYPSPVDPGYGK